MDKSKSDILRDDIDKALDGGYDFSSMSSRKQFLIDFCESHSDVFNKDRDRTLFIKIFQGCLKDRGIDPATIMKKKMVPRFNTKLASDMAAKTSAKPSGIKEELKLETTIQPLQTGIPDKDESVLQGSTPIKYEHWNPKAVGALFQSLTIPVKAKWPEMPSLTEEEKDSLGDMWLPAFQRYGSEKFQYLVLPAIGTVAIMGSKISKARKLKKELEKEQAQNTEKKDDLND